jgi:hypothetical protein
MHVRKYNWVIIAQIINLHVVQQRHTPIDIEMFGQPAIGRDR